ncbi:MAG: RagB/SusD family nutrient uptake outer membrane protein [Flammeovirgaceae bacterium]
MKKNKNIIKSILLIFLIALGSCDVLEQEPADLIDNELAIVDARSAEAAVIGLYDNLQSGSLYGGEFIMAVEMIGNNARPAAFQAFWAELGSGRVPPANAYIEDAWVSSYAVINLSNAIIANVPDLGDMSAEAKNEALGVAYFMRGLIFFDLLRQYGEFEDLNSTFGIPIKLEPALEFTLAETSRSTVAQSFQQIENDLNEAINRLPDTNNKFFASLGAAHALLARVHLYQKEYAEAEMYAEAVIANTSYSLSSDYNEIYINEGESGSPESIFELNFIELNDPNAWAVAMYNAPPEVATTRELFDFYNDRGETSRNALYEDLGSVIRCLKYGNINTDNGENTILFRLSEMYLIRAEAQALKTGGRPEDALADINTIRNRAGLASLDAVDIDTESELLAVLIDERRAEFAFEGHYKFDLIRYDLFEEVLGLESFRRRLPIPLREMNITDGALVQNPNY